MIEETQGWKVAARTAVEVGITGFGLAIGGPFGALVAAAVKPTLELIALRKDEGLTTSSGSSSR